MQGRILTYGGGGFSDSGDGSSLLDDLLLSLTGRDRPRVCFVPTASGDDRLYVELFLRAFEGRATTSVLSLFGTQPWGYADPAVVLDQDVIVVGGGSTANLLAVWRLHGLDRLLVRAAAEGTVLSGVSAGMNCWFEGSSTDSFGPLRALPDGLGLLAGSSCPHYRGEPDREESYRRMVSDGELPDGYAVDDAVALLWEDGALVEAVAEVPGAEAFRVERTPDGVVELPVPVRLLP